MRKPFRLTEAMRSRIKKTAALAYVEAGHPILALFGVTDGACDCGTPNCPSAGKHPMTRHFPHGFKDATTNVDTIERIWTKHPNANIGLVPTGDLLIVDIDGPKGEAFVAGLNLPETLAQRTGKGRHEVFTCEGLSGWKASKFEGVDFRFNANGYVAVSPSTHVSDAPTAGVRDRIDRPSSTTASSRLPACCGSISARRLRRSRKAGETRASPASPGRCAPRVCRKRPSRKAWRRSIARSAIRPCRRTRCARSPRASVPIRRRAKRPSATSPTSRSKRWLGSCGPTSRVASPA